MRLGNKMAKTDGVYFSSLTGVRAIAAYMVFMHHYNFFQGGILRDLSTELHTGVTLFFVLSGFLIAFRYLYNNEFSFKKYLVNRIARIYPMYFLLTTGTFLFYAIFRNSHGLSYFLVYLSNITFVRGYFDTFKFTGIEQGWSLTVEETFYFLAPVIFIFVRRSMLSLIIIPVVLILFGMLMVYGFSNLNIFGFFASNGFMFIYTFFGRCFEFFIGIGLAIFFKNNSLQRNIPYATCFGSLALILCIYWMSTFGAHSGSGILHPAGKLINNFILPLFGIAPLFYGLLTEKTLLSKLLGSSIFVLLGKSSYIFYLIHIGIIANLLRSFNLNVFLVFVFLNIISIILYRFLEEPLNVFIRRKFSGQAFKPATEIIPL